VPALLIDLVAVLVFVLVGRHSHGEGEAPVDVLNTLWPFVAGLAVGWGVLLRRHLAPTELRAGVVTGVFAAVVGLALRAIAGQGVAPAFGIVAVVVLTVFMVAWRMLARILLR
jgi:hypothetical protein